MHVQTLFPGRLGRGRKAIVNCPTETAELDSSLMCEMPVPRVAELESPIEIRQPDHGSQTGYAYDHTMTNLNALGSWSEIPELPADFAITPATSHDQFELSPMTAKDRLDYPGFCLGGANDFPTSVIPDAFELFSPLSEELIQECAGGTRLRNPGFAQLAAVPESAGAEEHSYPQPSYQTSFGQKPKQRSPRLPNLTLQTAGIQGKFLSPQSSRRPSIPGNVCATTPSQYSSATTSSRTHSSWSWTPASSTSWPSNPSSGLPSSNQNLCFTNATWSAGYSVPRDAHNTLFSPDVARHPTTAVISTPLFGELPSYASFFSAHSTAKPYPSPTNNNKNSNNNEDLFYFDPSPSVPTTSSSPAFPIIQHPPHPSAPPPPNSQPPQPQPQPSQPSPHQPRPHTPPTEPQPPPAAAAKDVCERCGLHFKSNPRDLARNKRRHLEISCRFREREAERIACSSPGCGKTFARDCARRIHERNKHGMEMVVGTGRRGRVVRRVRSVG